LAADFLEGFRESALRISTVSRSLRANRLALKIFVVQSGVRGEDVSPAQLELLGVTELYLRETYDCEFEFVGS
jgi:hypothetical protein